MQATLRILTEKKTPSNKTQAAYEKYEHGHLGCWYNKSTLKVATGKTLFFVIDPFCSHQIICLNIGFWYGTFAWKWCAFKLSIRKKCFQLKNGTPVFWKRFSFSTKSVSKLKYWKHSKFSVINTYKHADLLNGGLFWKSLVAFFRRTYALLLALKQNL